MKSLGGVEYMRPLPEMLKVCASSPASSWPIASLIIQRDCQIQPTMPEFTGNTEVLSIAQKSNRENAKQCESSSATAIGGHCSLTLGKLL